MNDQGEATPLPRRFLGRTDVSVTTLGFGAAAIGNLYAPVGEPQARGAVDAAWASGVRYFDTAPHYGFGLSERRLGAALEGREGAVLSTKVGRRLVPVAASARGGDVRHGFADADPFEPVFDYGYDGVRSAFDASLRRLGRDGVDVAYAHDLGEATHGADHARRTAEFLDGGYPALRALKAEGRVRAVGLGVNEWRVCEAVMAHADLDVVLLAGRYTLLEQRALDSFLPACVAKGVSVVVGGPFNSGVLAPRPPTGGPRYDYAPAPPQVLAKVERLREVCAAHGVPLAAAALQFPLAHPAVASVIPGCADAGQAQEAARLSAVPIPGGLWDALKAQGLLHPDAPTPAGADG